MKAYQNTSGNSIISAYEVGADYIKVIFTDSGKIFKYSYRSAKERHVENMKALAISGRGLGTYISENIYKKFDQPAPGVFTSIKNILRF